MHHAFARANAMKKLVWVICKISVGVDERDSASVMIHCLY
jgi:hypothetical protein